MYCDTLSDLFYRTPFGLDGINERCLVGVSISGESERSSLALAIGLHALSTNQRICTQPFKIGMTRRVLPLRCISLAAHPC